VCLVFGRRAALAACAEPAPAADAVPAPEERVAEPPGEETRAALWKHAGLCREAEGLAALREDPHPLARLIGAACLAREESRGAHQRTDFPDTDEALDCMHALLGRDEEPEFKRWL
jgi:L-aspartate oxidase